MLALYRGLQVPEVTAGMCIGDPYWANVTVQLHLNSEPLVNAANGAFVLSKIGTGTSGVDTAAKKFGAGSYRQNDQVVWWNCTDDKGAFGFGANDFTIDFWWRYDGTTAGTGNFCASGNTSIGATGVGNLTMSVNIGGSYRVLTAAGSNDGAWHHFEYSRNSTKLRLFMDGVMVDSKTSITGSAGSSTTFWIGYQSVGNYTYCHVDEFRVTNGVCRHPADSSFSLWSLPYCDSTSSGGVGTNAGDTVLVSMASISAGASALSSLQLGAAPPAYVDVRPFGGPGPGAPLLIDRNDGQLPVVAAQISGNGNGPGTFSVQYETYDITAVAGTDYTAASGTWTWSGVGSTVVSVPILDPSNALLQADKQFGVRLKNPVGFTLRPGGDKFVVTIRDNRKDNAMAAARAGGSQAAGYYEWQYTLTLAYASDVKISYQLKTDAYVPGQILAPSSSVNGGGSYQAMSPGGLPWSQQQLTLPAGVKVFRIRQAVAGASVPDATMYVAIPGRFGQPNDLV